MSHVTSGSGRARRQLTTQIRDALRDLHNQLSTLNRQVGVQLAIKDTDMDCLDLISRHGPLSPSSLARQAGLHPATMTGILDRLENAGWIARERDPADRRAITVRALPDRGREMYHLFAGMNSALDSICGDYDEQQLELLADFLRRSTEAGLTATHNLTAGTGQATT
ncbi:MarR family transcriptional regulator [Actinoplanes sp. ATCC 53533]|uniref:MarR family winged helix-turn-helix transcriptional regulator n=1 Tax=Actinoplanes sp. ATCC 53533 TaxID=1288362 RepID=UPI000F7B95EE|nr:MarR family transcriptional regulator [Actinoplanes sp. ATCC 53533]RSM72548.1 MarR family transcriptional regulator [Actinoplanes sp. ATCC 53533]